MVRISRFMVIVSLAGLLGCDGPGETSSGESGSGGSGGAPSSGGGGSGGTLSSGGSGGAMCVPVDDGNPCTEDICESGMPVHDPVAAGTACSMGGTQCDGNGSCVECLAPADCPAALEACKVAACTQGKCGIDAAPEGIACDDGDGCTAGDACQAGVCASGAPIACSALDGCHKAGTCDPATGACSNPPEPDGLSCDDGNACTQADSCTAGTCTGKDAVVCAALDQCHAAGACDPATGLCSDPPQPDGFACNDGDLCTQADSCQGGACGGSLLVCGGGASCVNGACPAPACTGAIGFPGLPAPSTIGFGAFYPVSLAAGDLNGDGTSDLAVADDQVGVMLGLGDGFFAPVTHYDAMPGYSFSAAAVAMADLNGDGALDIAVANGYNDAASVLINQGNGTFVASPSYPVGDNPVSITVADLNGDGAPDLATTNVYGHNVSVLLNQGNGTFAPAVDYPAGSNPRGTVAADLNGDGKLDLAVADEYAIGGVLVLLNQGGGAFTAPVSYVNSIPANSLAAADLNGDGKPDLVIPNQGFGNVIVLLNQGNGTFAAPLYFAAGLNPYAVTAADLNGDGAVDLAVRSTGDFNNVEDFVSLLYNQGNGTFAAPLHQPVLGAGSPVVATDLNGDGTLDLAAANQDKFNVSLLLNKGGGAFTSGIPMTRYWTPTEYPAGFAVVDHNADGKPDLAGVGGRENGYLYFLDNQPDGTFVQTAVYPAGSYPGNIAEADYNGDGRLDFTVTNYYSSEVSVLLQQADGNFAAPVAYPVLAPVDVGAADLNGDGKPDIAAVSGIDNEVKVLLNQGDGTFAAATGHAVGASPNSLVVGDLNGDGKPDLAVSSYYSDDVSVLLNQGNGAFSAAVHHAAGDGPATLAEGDLDGDGDLDLAVANHDSDDVSVLLNQGNGAFSAAVHYPAVEDPTDIAVVDLDSDGRPDLAITNADFTGTGHMIVLFNNGNGTFAPALRYGAGSSPVSIAAGDLNVDGRLDLVVTNYDGNDVSVMLTTCLP